MEQNVQGVQPKSKKRIGCWIAGCLTLLVVAVLFIMGVIGVAFWATKGPIIVIQEQLTYLRKGDIESAYLLTSGDFRKATNLEQFRQFVLSNPSLAQNKSASFKSRKVENDRGYVEGTLTALDGSKTPVKYDLIKEGDKWKILYMEVFQRGIETSTVKEAVEETVTPSGTVIEKIEVGTIRNPDGSIGDAVTGFPQGTGEIKVSAYVSGAKSGQLISAIWFFAGEQISDPVTNIIEEDGDFITQFSITPPANGWPTGSYKVVISTDKENISKELDYTVGM